MPFVNYKNRVLCGFYRLIFEIMIRRIYTANTASDIMLLITFSLKYSSIIIYSKRKEANYPKLSDS